MENGNNKIIDSLCEFIKEKIDATLADSLVSFSRHYFEAVPLDDIESTAVADLYGAVLSHWNLALQYQPGSEKIKVYNPSLEADGWQSSHTIIEIVIEDMPFLLQSVSNEINCHGLTYHLVINPVYYVIRDDNHEFVRFAEAEDEQVSSECLLHLEIDRQTDPQKLEAIRRRIKEVLVDVRAATQDWQSCLGKMQEVIATLSANGQTASLDNLETTRFLQWLCDNHFVFLGYREYELVTSQEKQYLKGVPGSGLGVLRDSIAKRTAGELVPLTAEFVEADSKLLMITKATSKATVHRSVFMDYIGIKQYDDSGQFCGEKRFLGLYSSIAYIAELSSIPLIREKINHVIERFDFRPGSHQSRSLYYILRSLPRDEIFQADVQQLYDCVAAVLQLQNRQRIKVFARHDIWGHFISLLIFVPRERYNTDSRKKIQQILLAFFSAQHADFSVQLSESILARIHFIIRTDADYRIDYDIRELERKIVDVLADWKDGLLSDLINFHGEAKANQLFDAYQDGFSTAYREETSTRTAVLDLECLETLLAGDSEVESLLYSPLTATLNKSLRFKLFSRVQASLSRSLPMLENMGVKVSEERPNKIYKKHYQEPLWLHDFGLLIEEGHNHINLESLKPRFQDAFENCWFGHAENDGFNQLIIKAGISWQEVSIFRAFYFYLRQVGIAFSQAYVEETLAKNPDVVRLLVRYFVQRFDPSLEPNENSQEELHTTIEKAIDQVVSLDEDRILRRFLNLIQSALRTNYFTGSVDEQNIPYLSIKFDSSAVFDVPPPVPHVEIFVYSPRMEGIHLRGGAVARGGLRWSDRREDFRTEILGLMKAQMTKNSVIVPTGAKGGFVVKRLTSITSAAAQNDEVVGCYRILIRGLLDLTDNLVNGQVVKPPKVNCYDDDDMYLVVAADKGTARFSDYANALSKQYGFWLDDAFASGGSNGYDHKKMGITARGAWESVKHHFSCLGVNYLEQTFTAVGIGGMAGDVFGNGLLLSDKIKLIGAFDHQHIFLDPEPVPEAALQERKRLFQIPGVSWSDYDSTLISKGGGVYSRQLKSIQLSPQIKARLNVQTERVTPNELIKCLLAAPVDLLWNGGIGTYVKAEQETNLQVGDRTNDALRINGNQLRCRVATEGGNLGFTQAGRIEFAAKGGVVNTDSIDNSAGVDCSDHEVNIKILLDELIRQGDLTDKQRNQLLESMTQDVAELVLLNNAAQNQVITLIEHSSVNEMQSVQWLIQLLEQHGELIRDQENIPSDDLLLERVSHNKGLLRPEICVLLAYSKQLLKKQLLQDLSGLEQSLFQAELFGYFPKVLQRQYPQPISQHYLARDIAVNGLVNNLINRMGVIFPFRLMEESGLEISTIIEIYRYVSDIFAIDELWKQVEQCYLQLNAAVVLTLFNHLQQLIDRALHWFLNVDEHLQSAEDVQPYKHGIEQLKNALPEFMSAEANVRIDEAVEHFIQQGVPASLALNIVTSDMMYFYLDVIWLHKQTQYTLQDCARVFFQLFESLEFLWLREQINQLAKSSLWQSLARQTCRKEFNAVSRALSLSVLQLEGGGCEDKIQRWFETNEKSLTRYRKLQSKVKADATVELEKVTVLLKELQDIAAVCPLKSQTLLI